MVPVNSPLRELTKKVVQDKVDDIADEDKDHSIPH